MEECSKVMFEQIGLILKYIFSRVRELVVLFALCSSPAFAKDSVIENSGRTFQFQEGEIWISAYRQAEEYYMLNNIVEDEIYYLAQLELVVRCEVASLVASSVNKNLESYFQEELKSYLGKKDAVFWEGLAEYLQSEAAPLTKLTGLNMEDGFAKYQEIKQSDYSRYLRYFEMQRNITDPSRYDFFKSDLDTCKTIFAGQ